MDQLRKSCCCPSFILAAAGPWMCVLGAIFLEQPVIEPLTDFIWIGRRDCLSDGIESVAQILQALATSLNSLDSFYNTSTSRWPQGAFILYRHSGWRAWPTKSGVQGSDIEASSRAIVVKFTRRYNGQAHELLAAHGYAPKLRFNGSKYPEFPRPVGLLMMVMEYIVEALRGPSYDEAYPTLRAGLDHPHERRLVFGDLRPLNVLVPKRLTGQKAKAMLIDFDWCGKDGEDRYPWDINTEIAWADDVGPGRERLAHVFAGLVGVPSGMDLQGTFTGHFNGILNSATYNVFNAFARTTGTLWTARTDNENRDWYFEGGQGEH
ncbi:hypothetical protein FRC06_008887 [Ceratobasidium sp. 370]|nr:hypothetical protein FRC06_008887 [Ceratobasidium sp. 370]